MKNISEIALLGLFWGMIGTTIGGILGSILKIKTNKTLGFILEFAAGLMTSIICFDLIPEALTYGNINYSIIGIILGIIVMIICDNIVKKVSEKNLSRDYSGKNSNQNTNANKIKVKKQVYKKSDKKLLHDYNSLIHTGLVIFIGLTVHNFPEGLAIGSGFDASNSLGLSLAIAIAIHDIPEGISIALPLKNGGVGIVKAILITALSGLTTGIGAFFGAVIGNVSSSFICVSLAFAAGAMLYIVSCELIPESKNMYHGRFNSMGNICGIIIGIIAHLYI